MCQANPDKSLNCSPKFKTGQRGFSTIDMVIVVVVLMLIASIAIPQILGSMRAYRAMSDARSIASLLALTKMRAANSFSQARLNCDTAARNCQVQVCTTKGASTCTTFTSEGSTINLSTGVSFGFGSITSAAGAQSSIANSSQILFNSRGIPVDNAGAPTANYATYLRNNDGDNYAVSVYSNGRIAVWRYGSSSWNLQ